MKIVRDWSVKGELEIKKILENIENDIKQVLAEKPYYSKWVHIKTEVSMS